MLQRRFGYRRWVQITVVVAASVLVLARAVAAMADLAAGNPNQFLSLPLAVILPFVTLIYFVRLPETTSSEGAIMRLAMIIQILLILALPAFALHLALGFPVALLVVELFETRLPPVFRDDLKRRVLR